MTNPQKNIFIIGAGAIGKVLAVLLKLAGHNVIVLRGSVDDNSTHTQHIQVKLSDATQLEANIDISTLSNYPVLDGLIVLTNKSYGNGQLSQALQGKTGSSPIVILQNGLQVEQPFITNGFANIYRCVLFATSQHITPDKLRFRPVAISPVGIIKGDKDILAGIVQQLHTAHFGFREEANIETVIWKKTIVNSVFNSVCPLLEIDNGVFHRNQQALQIAGRIITECVFIAQQAGVPLSEAEVTESLLLISHASDGQLISTYQDIKNRRKTEIDTLNFAIAAIAQQLGKADAIKETLLLGELTKLKSELNL